MRAIEFRRTEIYCVADDQMPRTPRIKNYVVLAAVTLLVSIFVTLRICLCPDSEGGCAELSAMDYYDGCLAPHWRSAVWIALAVIGAVLVYK